MSDNIGKYSERYTKIRTLASGEKDIDGLTGPTKYLEIDSGIVGVEILSIQITFLSVEGGDSDWKCGLYVPEDDAASIPVTADKRDEFRWTWTDTAVAGHGLIAGVIGVPYNMFLNFTNYIGAWRTITDVILNYRSKEALTLTWETNGGS